LALHDRLEVNPRDHLRRPVKGVFEPDLRQPPEHQEPHLQHLHRVFPALWAKAHDSKRRRQPGKNSGGEYFTGGGLVLLHPDLEFVPGADQLQRLHVPLGQHGGVSHPGVP
jgi:hypothetical protein